MFQTVTGIIFTLWIIISLGDNFDPNDEDLLDFLSNFKCFTKVTGGNISQVIHELAHKVHY